MQYWLIWIIIFEKVIDIILQSKIDNIFYKTCNTTYRLCQSVGASILASVNVDIKWLDNDNGLCPERIIFSLSLCQDLFDHIVC